MVPTSGGGNKATFRRVLSREVGIETTVSHSLPVHPEWTNCDEGGVISGVINAFEGHQMRSGWRVHTLEQTVTHLFAGLSAKQIAAAKR